VPQACIYVNARELDAKGIHTENRKVWKSVRGSVAPNNESLAFLESRYDGLLPSFPHSSSINVGLDETFDIGTAKSK
jgi:hypothetical protein